MNSSSISTNSTKSLVDQIFIEFVINFTGLNGYYVIPGISIIGTFLNLISLIVLMNVKFRERFKFIIVKIAVEMCGSLIGIGFQNYLICIIDNYILNISCTETGSYTFQLMRIVFYKYFSVVIYIWSATNEILLTIDRYLILKDHKVWFNKPSSFKYIVFINGALAIVIYSPYLFANQVVLVANSTNTYYLQLTKYGASTENSMFALIMHGLMNIVLFAVIMPLSILVIIEFRRFIKNRSSLNEINTLSSTTQNSIQTYRSKLFRKTEANMIKMTITLSFFLVVLRAFDLVSTTLYRYSVVTSNLTGVRASTPYKLFLVIIGNVAYTIIFAQSGMNFFILFAFNKQFRQSFRSIYLKEKVIQVRNFIKTKTFT